VRAGASRTLALLARLVDLITAAVVLLIVLGIVLVVLKANPANQIVTWVHDAASFLAGPFDNLFKLRNPRTETAVNWGIAAVVYLIVGRFIARLLRRGA
jgi:membrane-bound ClpP family serine protease